MEPSEEETFKVLKRKPLSSVWSELRKHVYHGTFTSNEEIVNSMGWEYEDFVEANKKRHAAKINQLTKDKQ